MEERQVDISSYHRRKGIRIVEVRKHLVSTRNTQSRDIDRSSWRTFNIGIPEEVAQHNSASPSQQRKRRRPTANLMS